MGRISVNLEEMIIWMSVGFQLAAAFLWFASTIVKRDAAVVAAEYQKIHGAKSGTFQIISDDGSDFIETAERQVFWGRWAALATGVGIGLQAIATALFH